MPNPFVGDHLRFLLNRLSDRLWVKPLFMCLLSIGAVFMAKLTEQFSLNWLPTANIESLVKLLSIMASSMLVIATFSVTSMVSAYNSASTTATPRAFTVVVADDVSQNALSTFIGAFIFSIVALISVTNSVFEDSGIFALFVLTGCVFAMVIFTFIRWVDRLARLGRVGSTIDRVENATTQAFIRRRDAPHLCGIAVRKTEQKGIMLAAKKVGYIQHINMSALQLLADKHQIQLVLQVLPGSFVASGSTLALLMIDSQAEENRPEITENDMDKIIAAFQIGRDRLFDDDPRFGLIVLGEIAGKALSPAVNDPGTAIKVIGALVRLFSLWNAPHQQESPLFNRIQVTPLALSCMFSDAFTAIARDGAGSIEVMIRLQKAFIMLHSNGDTDMQQATQTHAALAFKRCQHAMTLEEDIQAVKAVSLLTAKSHS